MKQHIQSLPLLKQGKVRDIYTIDDHHILIIASDRLSCFDVVLPDEIPHKGCVLTTLSNFWFEKTCDIVDNHLTNIAIKDVLPTTELSDDLRARSVVAKKLTPLPLEAIVRGYLFGSGWKDYCATTTICGIKLPKGLQVAQALPSPLFTCSTKAPAGKHDINVPFAEIENLIGKELAEKVRDTSLSIYKSCAAYALERGIIIADTKFEFGIDTTGTLTLIDEVLTPDSSRFWSLEQHQPGLSPPNFDKQFVRDYLETLSWNKRAPGPHLPPEIIKKTAEKYRQAQSILVDDA